MVSGVLYVTLLTSAACEPELRQSAGSPVCRSRLHSSSGRSVAICVRMGDSVYSEQARLTVARMWLLKTPVPQSSRLMPDVASLYALLMCGVYVRPWVEPNTPRNELTAIVKSILSSTTVAISARLSSSARLSRCVRASVSSSK